MAKIKKIKKDMLKELGDEFEMLTDAEVAESGITLAEDEILVVAVPAPTQPSQNNGNDNSAQVIEDLRTRLHAANQESASRRISLKERDAEIDKLSKQVAKLQGTVGQNEVDAAKRKAESTFSEYVKEKKINFIDDQAGIDVRDTIFSSIDWTKEVNKEVLGPLVDEMVTKKKYLLKSTELPKTDGGQQSNVENGAVPIDLEAIARDFNLPMQKEGTK